jgi:hypothetical protein
MKRVMLAAGVALLVALHVSGSAFHVTAAKQNGRLESVQLRSEAGSVVRVRNPWGGGAVTISRNGRHWQQLKGTLLTFDTEIGDELELRNR